MDFHTAFGWWFFSLNIWPDADTSIVYLKSWKINRNSSWEIGLGISLALFSCTLPTCFAMQHVLEENITWHLKLLSISNVPSEISRMLGPEHEPGRKVCVFFTLSSFSPWNVPLSMSHFAFLCLRFSTSKGVGWSSKAMVSVFLYSTVVILPSWDQVDTCGFKQWASKQRKYRLQGCEWVHIAFVIVSIEGKIFSILW